MVRHNHKKEPILAATSSRYNQGSLAIAVPFILFLLIGQNAIAFFSPLVGPFIGTTGVLWLMICNNTAINPRAPWM
jgi:hypothetical protein